MGLRVYTSPALTSTSGALNFDQGENDKTPAGPATGDLGATYPSPTVVALHTGATKLTVGTVNDGEALVRSGTALVSAPIPTTFPPSGAAGGDLGASYPSPTVVALHTGATKLSVGTLNDGELLWRVGASVQSTPLPASLPPSGAAGGDLGASYPSPTVVALHTGATKLTVGTVNDGEALVRSGTALVSAPIPTSLPPSGAAGGDLSASFPNPSVVALHIGSTSYPIGSVGGGQSLQRAKGSTAVRGFDPLLDINPRNYWRAVNAVTSGGVVTSVPDVGRVAKTMSPGAGMPIATDGLGNVYLAPNGTSHYLKAGVAADWNFLNNPVLAYTIGFIAAYPSHPAAQPSWLATYDGAGANRGLLGVTNINSGNWGPRFIVNAAPTGIALDFNVNCLAAANVHVVTMQVLVTGFTGGGTWATIYNRGEIVADGSSLAVQLSNSGVTGFNSGDPTGAGLFLFTNSALTSFSGMRLYELWIENNPVPARQLAAYAAWAAAYFGTAS
jgi:hypothetical protein